MISVSPGTSPRSARSACWTIPSASQAPEPSSSFSSGTPNRSTALHDPSRWSSAHSRTTSSTERCAIPSSPVDRPHDSFARAGEERHHDVVEGEMRLAHERAQAVGAPQAAQSCRGKHRHAPKVMPSGAEEGAVNRRVSPRWSPPAQWDASPTSGGKCRNRRCRHEERGARPTDAICAHRDDDADRLAAAAGRRGHVDTATW